MEGFIFLMVLGGVISAVIVHFLYMEEKFGRLKVLAAVYGLVVVTLVFLSVVTSGYTALGFLFYAFIVGIPSVASWVVGLLSGWLRKRYGVGNS